MQLNSTASKNMHGISITINKSTDFDAVTSEPQGEKMLLISEYGKAIYVIKIMKQKALVQSAVMMCKSLSLVVINW